MTAPTPSPNITHDNYARLCAYLEHKGVTFTKDEAFLAVNFSLPLHATPVSAHASTLDPEVLQVTVTLPFQTPELQLLDLAELAHRMNALCRAGAFMFDFASGELRFRVTHWTGGGPIARRTFEWAFSCAFRTVEGWILQIERVLFAGDEPAEVIEEEIRDNYALLDGPN